MPPVLMIPMFVDNKCFAQKGGKCIYSLVFFSVSQFEKWPEDEN